MYPEDRIAYHEKLELKGVETLTYNAEKDGEFHTWKGFLPSMCFVKQGIGYLRINQPGRYITSIKIIYEYIVYL